MNSNLGTASAGMIALTTVAAACLLAVMAGIWALTEQDAVGSSALSSSVESAVKDEAARTANDATQGPAGGSGDAVAEGDGEGGGPIAVAVGALESSGNAVREGVFSLAESLIAQFGVRRLAHTAELFAMGVAAAATVALRPGRRVRRPAALCLAGALCLAWLVLSQVHKAFVPGRHFDGVDLAFDAAGYLAAMALAALAWALASKLKDC